MKRRTTEDEKRLFRETVETSRPQVIAKAKPKKPAGKTNSGAGALDGNTKERLKRGGVRPQASMDLHGMTQKEAHRALLSFLQRARKNGLRLTVVVTGKGNPDKEETSAWSSQRHGVLKEMVPRWLNEPEFAALITGTAPAHIRHGGGGALYVYLRKPE